MKTAVFGIVIAVLVFASALAHGIYGWSAVREALSTYAVHSDIMGALAVGWYFGSAAMLTFACVILRDAVRQLGRKSVDSGTLWIIALAYVLFGAIAFIAREFNPHFLLFIVTGILVGAFSFLCSKRREHSEIS